MSSGFRVDMNEFIPSSQNTHTIQTVNINPNLCTLHSNGSLLAWNETKDYIDFVDPMYFTGPTGYTGPMGYTGSV